MGNGYSKYDQLGPEKKKDGRSFREKYGKPLKKKPYQLKRTPLKQSNKPIKQQSTKQAAKLASYEKGKREKYDIDLRVCECCGANDGGISCSHIVSRSTSHALLDYPLNHVAACYNCHDDMECLRYYKLKNGLKIMGLLFDGLGGIGKQLLRKALYHKDHGELNMNLWKMSPFYPAYEQEMKNF